MKAPDGAAGRGQGDGLHEASIILLRAFGELAPLAASCDTRRVHAHLVKLFQDAELTREEAASTARQVMLRLRARPGSEALGAATAFGQWSYKKPARITEALDPSPEGALARLVAPPSQENLPFLDEDEPERLSVVSFAEVMAVAGVDPVVAMASARLLVELNDAEALYGPLWQACGEGGTFHPTALAQKNWRAHLPAL